MFNVNFFINLIEVGFSFMLFVNGILFIPQIVKLYKTKNADGFSIVTFLGFLLIQSSAVAYGIIRDDLYIIFGYVFSLSTCFVVFSLIVYYRYVNR